MNSDKQLNDLLKWSIENSDATRNDPNAQVAPGGGTQLSPDVLNAIMGGPSEADLMKANMEIIGVASAFDVIPLALEHRPQKAANAFIPQHAHTGAAAAQ